MASGAEYEITEVGVMTPNQIPVTTLRSGEVGYLCASIKDVKDAKVGDTICLASDWKSENKPIALPGYADSNPMVFCGLFPTDADQYENLRDSLGKLALNDASLKVSVILTYKMKPLSL